NRLEVKLRAQLDNSACDCSRCNAPKVGAGYVVVWVIELRVVEDVKPFDAHLQVLAFANSGLFHQGKVGVVESRPVERVASGVAEPAADIPIEPGARGAGSVAATGHLGEGQWIEPVVLTHIAA